MIIVTDKSNSGDRNRSVPDVISADPDVAAVAKRELMEPASREEVTRFVKTGMSDSQEQDQAPAKRELT